MGRMNTPKMEVVRFKEQDVIVASGWDRRSLNLSGFGDGNRTNGKIRFDSKLFNVGETGRDAFRTSFTDDTKEDYYDYGVYIDNRDGGYTTISSLIFDETSVDGFNSPNWDGNYYWTGSIFKKQ